MLVRYVWADLVRNPRRTLATVAGVVLGIGLTCAVLFFVDGLSASMTQRAVAPLPIDMQRVLTQPAAGDVQLSLKLEPTGQVEQGRMIHVRMELVNRGKTAANEVVVRSVPAAGLAYVEGSAAIDGKVVATKGENPFASGPAKAGLNIGTLAPGASVVFEYQATVTTARDISEQALASTFSTREAVTPVEANAAKPMSLADLAARIRALNGVAFAEQLSFVDLPPGSLAAGAPVSNPVRLFGFDPSYIQHDATIKIVQGSQVAGEAMLSAEAAKSLAVTVGDAISFELPDGTRSKARVSGIVDLTRARSLFSSRRGATLETFIYVPNSVIVDAASFTDIVVPAFERASTGGGERLKSPPVREVDIGIERELLNSEPSVALSETQRIAATISGVAGKQDFLLDNISNTLSVARDDALVAKRMFVFLGFPGAVLAAMLAAYAGIVLAGAQRREQATLRIRGANRGHLLAMLAMRVSCITVAGALIGVALGYATVATVIGQSTLMRATTATLITSALLGTVAGLLATGSALYITGRRSIDREIHEDRALLWLRPPAWRRFRLDLVGMAVVVAITVVVIANSGFRGTPGSVYVGRSVELPLSLLFLPIAAWISGSLIGGRVFAWFLARSRTDSSHDLDRPFLLLYRRSIKRRSWVLVDAVVILGMIIALGTSLAVFTASYNGAKAADARYSLGSDLRIAASPASKRTYLGANAADFAIEGVDAVAPVVYGVHNVVLRSNRTEEVANLAALDPVAYARVAPLDGTHFSSGSPAQALDLLTVKPNAILLSMHMADFLQVKPGDTVHVLLARSMAQQVEIDMELVGLFERLPGFPDGADALMNIGRHEEMVPSTVPAFFLARTSDRSDAALVRTATALRNGLGNSDALQIDTRLTALAKDQSSLAALNIGGLLKIDGSYSLAMGTVAIAIFVFGLILAPPLE